MTNLKAAVLAEPLKTYIKRVYGTGKAYAQATGKAPPRGSEYIKKRYWVIDGELYAPVKLTKGKE